MKILDCRRNYALHLFLPVFTLLCSACVSPENLRDYSGQPLPSSVSELTVMTYNIRVGAGTDNPYWDVRGLPKGKNLSGVITAIKYVDADIVALQEVAGSGQAKELATALNMNFVFVYHDTAAYDPLWWGVAILSKFPILAAKGVPISTGYRNSRNIVLATVDVAGTPLTFVSIHKDHKLTGGSSLRSIRGAISDVQGPVVLAGDFNIQPWDTRLDVLRPRFVDTARVVDTEGARDAISKGTGKWFGRIDYVFSEVSSFKVIDAGLSPHLRESDHYAYWARLSLNTGDDDWDVEAPLVKAKTSDGSLKPPVGAVRMTGSEIEAVVVGNSWIYPNNDGGAYFDHNGDLIVSWDGRISSNQWYLKNDEICLDIKLWDGEWCYEFYKLDGGIVTYEEYYAEFVKVLLEPGNRF